MGFRSAWLDAAPLVIAHRGASAVAPENTLPAFEQAAALGAEAVELDAKRTLDDEVVAFHDPSLHRITGADGSVGRRSLRELRQLDAGAWKSAAYQGVRIPTLSEIFEAVGRRLLINIELSDYWQGDQALLVERVVALVRSHRLSDRILLSSFDSSALAAAHRSAPEIARAHLYGPTRLAYRDRLRRKVPVHAHRTDRRFARVRSNPPTDRAAGSRLHRSG
jgi:glycerophosphoryl diester phosphodiesterase